MSDSPIDLYTETLLEHARHPRGRGRLSQADARVEGFNPLCGDRVEVSVGLADGEVRDLGFVGEGCAISTASASMMIDAVRGRTPGEAHDFIHRFLRALVSPDCGNDPEAEFGMDLSTLIHVRRLPMRVKCVTLAWRAADSAIADAARANLEKSP